MSKATGYVAYCKERLRDGVEEYAKIFDTKEDALDWMNKLCTSLFDGANCSFMLFEIGKRIEIKELVEETPQPPVKRKRFV